MGERRDCAARAMRRSGLFNSLGHSNDALSVELRPLPLPGKRILLSAEKHRSGDISPFWSTIKPNVSKPHNPQNGKTAQFAPGGLVSTGRDHGSQVLSSLSL